MGDSVQVVIESLDKHPVCEHGPSLLFERKNGDKCERFYACAAYRDQNECPLFIRSEQIEQFHQNAPSQEILTKLAENSLKLAMEKSHLLQKILKQTSENRIYCHVCHTFLEYIPNEIDRHKNHAIQRGITNHQIECPTTFLRSLSNDKREAQYFFSNESLNCFVRIIQHLKINKIVCIGAPRLHEHLKHNYRKLQIKSILLDLDTRFYSFFNRNDTPDYFHYNMFNNHFFAGQAAQISFHRFLRNENCCIFTDPPFGCRTEPLVHTLQTLSQTYRKINHTNDVLPIFWVFPYFMETYITKLMPEMEMCDYKVNYTNHETYHAGHDGRKQGSPVRLFTNVPVHQIDLATVEAYRLCKKCNKWVAHENQHCNRCKKCPSKNGAPYVHCNLCELCVKPTYRHCNNCWRCTQIEHHECHKYQMQLKCPICLQKGHNELNCQQWFALCGKHESQIIKLKLKAIKIGRRICLICFKTGHNEQFCTKRKQILNEHSFLSERSNRLTKQ